MIKDNVKIEILRFDFNQNLIRNPELENLHYAKDLWPVVYILTDGNIKQAYIGETTDTFSRLSTHLKNNDKNKLSEVHIISSNTFNKSATLDIESNLIKYFSGDGKYKLLNGNVGLANHNYYQKRELYWDVFKSIWDQLRAKGIAQHSVEHIDNSDLFKYSPYKTLSLDQRRSLMVIMQHLLNDQTQNIVMEGGAGTGKTILAVFLIKLICTDNDDFNFKEFGDEEKQFVELIIKLKLKYRNPKVALVVPMGSFRKTLQKVFKNISGLNPKMVIGPSDVFKEDYDIVLVDESHRLRRRVNLGPYFKIFDEVCDSLNLDKTKTNELAWMQMTKAKCIYFYDENQSIKPSDVLEEDFMKMKQAPTTVIEQLKSQFRVMGGNGYVDYIKNLLNCTLNQQPKYASKDYEFVLFDSIQDFLHELKLREKENGLSRLIAGYSWEWKSKNDKTAFDIEIENVQLRWNGTNIDWINTENAIDEVGCIHTTQGYDLNYAGIIFGHEITYNPTSNTIEIIRENYHDKAGKNTITDPEVLKNYILNIYKTILLRGIKGTYVYACDPNLRTYLALHIATYTVEKPNLHFQEHEPIIPFENAIPLYDLAAAAGGFSDAQQPTVLDWLKVPPHLSASEDLFACQVVGESMNKIIPNGALCLFRKYHYGSRDGKIVLVQSTDIQDPESGASYTVKEYESKKIVAEDTWQHDYIILKPKSYNPEFEPIALRKDELTDFRVVGVFEEVMN